MELPEFLLARIAEDEEAVNDRTGHLTPAGWSYLEQFGDFGDDERWMIEIPAARVLAECKAKRRIVEFMVNEVKDARRRPAWTMPDEQIDEKGRAYRMGAENQKAKELPDALDRTDRLLRFLALPYADHPDCREEWKP